jgi:hypothetical protein
MLCATSHLSHARHLGHARLRLQAASRTQHTTCVCAADTSLFIVGIAAMSYYGELHCTRHRFPMSTRPHPLPAVVTPGALWRQGIRCNCCTDAEKCLLKPVI